MKTTDIKLITIIMIEFIPVTIGNFSHHAAMVKDGAVLKGNKQEVNSAVALIPQFKLDMYKKYKIKQTEKDDYTFVWKRNTDAVNARIPLMEYISGTYLVANNFNQLFTAKYAEIFNLSMELGVIIELI